MSIYRPCGSCGRTHPFEYCFEAAPHFDGVTYEPQRDRTRLATELVKVRNVLESFPGRWWFLRDLSSYAKAPEASVSARLRDLRKPKFGGHTVDRRYVGDGLWQYRYTPAASTNGGAPLPPVSPADPPRRQVA